MTASSQVLGSPDKVPVLETSKIVTKPPVSVMSPSLKDVSHVPSKEIQHLPLKEIGHLPPKEGPKVRERLKSISHEVGDNRLKVKERIAPNPTRVPVNRAMYNPKMNTPRRGKTAVRGGCARGRSRAKSPARSLFGFEHRMNSIHRDLAGTAYDFVDEFDDDLQVEKVDDLRVMREKRLAEALSETGSVIHTKRRVSSASKSEEESRESVSVHSATSFEENREIGSSFGKVIQKYQDIQNSKTDLVVREEIGSPPSHMDKLVNDVSYQGEHDYMPSSGLPQHFQDLQPPLPGPVDMRTYSSCDPSSVPPASYPNHIFEAGGNTDIPVPGIDRMADLEEIEGINKELESALSVKPEDTESDKPSTYPPSTPGTAATPLTVNVSEVEPVKAELKSPIPPLVLPISAFTTPVSAPSQNSSSVLLNSRNQLKVKIKGPFLDSNYFSTPSAPPVTEPNPVTQSVTSSLRRMRKKELLHQYVNQDMNTDTTTSVPATQSYTPTTTPMNRTLMTIPKAVASMTTIPTRDDYKAVVDANLERKRRREKNVPRELRNLDWKIIDQEEGGGERGDRRRGRTDKNDDYEDKEASESTNRASSAEAAKRRGRPPKVRVTDVSIPPLNTVEFTPFSPTTKLKIKFKEKDREFSVVEPENKHRSRGRPPKKRYPEETLATIRTVEDLRKESMRFRAEVMAGFEEEEKETLGLVGKKRKRGVRSREDYDDNSDRSRSASPNQPLEDIQTDVVSQHVQIISNETMRVPKLIIKFGKKSDKVKISESDHSESTSRSEQRSESRFENESVLDKKSNVGSKPESASISAGDNSANTNRSASENASISETKCEAASTASYTSNKTVDIPVTSAVTESFSVKINLSSKTEQDRRKIMPIKLKLARCPDGYITKTQESDTNTDGRGHPQSITVTPESCEVR